MRCDICRCEPCSTPGFCEACRKVDARNKANPPPPPDLPLGWEQMQVGELWDALNDPERFQTPSSTLAAAEYLFNLGDEGRWADWLDRHSQHDRNAILKHLQALDKRRGA